MKDVPETLRFDDRFVRELPADPTREEDPHRVRPREVRGACYTRVVPTPVHAPETIAWSEEMAATLGFDPSFRNSDTFAQIFSGNRFLDGMKPQAACYGGQQFGNWAGQLGDGRAITLGEAIAPDETRWELQLKGAGKTPYSRGADGRAVLRSSVREFLCSEAMHHLGIPTTRALSLVATGEQVMRDMFYDGNPAPEPGAVVCRAAPTFLRFGSYQIHTARKDVDTLRQLVAHTLRHHFPDLVTENTPKGQECTPHAVVALLEEVCRRTALLASEWMRVGFVHGVLNTDNMSITGLSLDYGPYGWLEGFDPMWTPNTTDAQGRRYAFGRQPKICYWNCAQLGGAFVPLVDDQDALNRALQTFPETFEREHRRMMRQKIGLRGEDPRDDALIESLMEALGRVETDMTIFYRRLADLRSAGPPLSERSDEALVEPLLPAYYADDPLDAATRAEMPAWIRTWLTRLEEEGIEDASRRERMNAVNPKYVLRNWLAQEAIDQAESGDPSRIMEQLEVLRRPYDDQPGREHFAQRRPEWARHRAGCSMLSCSS